MSEKQIPYVITSMGNLKYDTNEPIYETNKNHKCREQIGGCQGGGVGEE